MWQVITLVNSILRCSETMILVLSLMQHYMPSRSSKDGTSAYASLKLYEKTIRFNDSCIRFSSAVRKNVQTTEKIDFFYLQARH